MQYHNQVTRTPADHPMDSRNWTILDHAGEKGSVLLIEFRRCPGGRNVDETVRSLLVEPDDPIAQRLAIHPPDFRCVFARRAIKDRSDGQQPACLPGMLSPPGELANVLGRVIRPNCKSISHGNPPFATLNHLPGDLGILLSRLFSALVLVAISACPSVIWRSSSCS